MLRATPVILALILSLPQSHLLAQNDTPRAAPGKTPEKAPEKTDEKKKVGSGSAPKRPVQPPHVPPPPRAAGEKIVKDPTVPTPNTPPAPPHY